MGEVRGFSSHTGEGSNSPEYMYAITAGMQALATVATLFSPLNATPTHTYHTTPIGKEGSRGGGRKEGRRKEGGREGHTRILGSVRSPLFATISMDSVFFRKISCSPVKSCFSTAEGRDRHTRKVSQYIHVPSIHSFPSSYTAIPMIHNYIH